MSGAPCVAPQCRHSCVLVGARSAGGNPDGAARPPTPGAMPAGWIMPAFHALKAALGTGEAPTGRGNTARLAGPGGLVADTYRRVRTRRSGSLQRYGARRNVRSSSGERGSHAAFDVSRRRAMGRAAPQTCQAILRCVRRAGGAQNDAQVAIVIPAQAGIQTTRSGLHTNARGDARGLSYIGPSGLARCVKGRCKPQRGEIPQPGSQGRATVPPKRIAEPGPDVAGPSREVFPRRSLRRKRPLTWGFWRPRRTRARAFIWLHFCVILRNFVSETEDHRCDQLPIF